MSTAYCNIKLQGKNVLTEKTYLVTMDIITKKEQDYYLNSGDSAESIDYSDVADVRFIMFYSASPFTLTFTKDAAIITIPVKDVFILAPNAMTGFDSIDLTALSTTDQKIEVKFYGEG